MICNVTYYGKTERHLKVRAGWHKHMSALTERRVNKSIKSVVKDHCIVSGHMYCFYGFTGVNYESRKFKRWVKESLFFKNDKLLVHKQIKSRKLHL